MTNDYENNFGKDLYRHMTANVCDAMEILKQSITGHKWTPLDENYQPIYWTHIKQTDRSATFKANVRYSMYDASKKAYQFLKPVTYYDPTNPPASNNLLYTTGTTRIGSMVYPATKIGDKAYTVYMEYPVQERSGGFPDRTLRRTYPMQIDGRDTEIVYSNAFDTKWFDSIGRYMMDTEVEGLDNFHMNAMSINAVAYTLPRLAKYLNYRNWRLRLLINAAVSTMVDKFVITYPTKDTTAKGTPVYGYKLTKDKYFQSFLTKDATFKSGKTYYKLDVTSGKLVVRDVDPSEIGQPITVTLYERYSPLKTYYTRSVNRARETYTEYAAEAGAPIRNEQSLVYRRSTDTLVDPTKHYYTTDDYINFHEVHPTGTENPLALGWYEMANTDYATYYERSTKYKTEYHEVEGYFKLTPDKKVAEGVMYYIREDKSPAEDPNTVFQFTWIHPEVGSNIPSGTYYELIPSPSTKKWMGNREDPKTHRFYVPVESGATVTAGYTYMYPGEEGDEYKPCSMLVEPTNGHYYYRLQKETYYRTRDVYYKEPYWNGTAYVASKNYYIKTGETYRPATFGTAAEVVAGTKDYVQCNYELTSDTTFQAATLYYVADPEHPGTYAKAKSGTPEEVAKGVADYVIGTSVPAGTFYNCVGPTIIPSSVEVYELGADGITYDYIPIDFSHTVGHICDDPTWDHIIFAPATAGGYDIVGKTYGCDTVIVGRTKNVSYTDLANCVLYRRLIVDEDTSVMTSKKGYLYVDAEDEVLTRVKNALNVFMTYYRTTLLMSGRSGTAYRLIANSMRYTTEDIIVRLNSIIESINMYAKNKIEPLEEDEYTVRNLKLKVNELIEYIVDEEYYGNLCSESYPRNLLAFEDDFWKWMGTEDVPGSLQYDMATTSNTLPAGTKYLSYNNCLFYYEPSLPYIRYAYDRIKWQKLYTSGDPSVGDIKKEVVTGTDGSVSDYYHVYVGKYPETTGTDYGWIPMHHIVNLYQITEMWSFSEYSASMQVLKLTKNLLETKTPDGNDWRDALSKPRKRDTKATNFSNVLAQINNMEARIDKILKIAPCAAKVMTDIFRWCASYNYSSMERCFPQGH